MNTDNINTPLDIAELISKFIFHCQYEKNLDIKTIKAYKTDLRQFQNFMNKNYKLHTINQITKENIKLYIKSVSHFKPKTTKRKIATIKAMFSFWEFEDDLFINPFHKIKLRIKEPKILPTVMDINEVSTILKTLYTEYNNIDKYTSHKKKTIIKNIVIIELLFSTGIRVSELCNLKITDIDFSNHHIKVFGKGGKERIINICQKNVWDILKLYTGLFKPQSYFLINRLGNQLSTQSVRLLIKKYVKQSNLDKQITPHTFRHTFATLLLEEDVDIKYIQNLLGHNSIVTTQIYTHVSNSKQKQILSKKHPRLKINSSI